MDVSNTSSLEASIASLQSSSNLLSSSIAVLDQGVHDFPRLQKVLEINRHFELVPESAVLSAQASLRDSIRPEVDNLLHRVELYLDKMARRQQSLIAKAELQEGRLQQSGKSGVKSKHRKEAQTGRPATFGSGGNGDKMRMLRAKKERLEYVVERLNLQLQQRERQLRKSMAAQ